MSASTSTDAAPLLPGRPVSALAASTSDQARWFEEEVQPHDASLRAYLRGAFPQVRDLDDVVQESYLRIWRARLARPIASTKSFLFQIARHFVIDSVRRTRTARTDALGDWSQLHVLEDKPDACATLVYTEKVEFLAEALVSLPTRCREIMLLRKFQHVSQAEISRRLGISERTVESQVTRGMRLVEVRLRARGVRGFTTDGD